MPKGISIETGMNWARGQTKETNESIRRMSELKTGKSNYWKGRHRNGQEVIDKIRDLYVNEKLSMNKIGEKLGMNQGTVFWYLKSLGVPTRSNSEAKKISLGFGGRIVLDKGALINFYVKERMPMIKVAEKMNVGINTIYDNLVRYGIERRVGGPWLGGISFEPYSPEFNKWLKEQIRQRDNFTCQLCGLIQSGRKHPVHHIDYNKKNSIPNNLITLCKKCHAKTNSKREYWINFFQHKGVLDG